MCLREVLKANLVKADAALLPAREQEHWRRRRLNLEQSCVNGSNRRDVRQGLVDLFRNRDSQGTPKKNDNFCVFCGGADEAPTARRRHAVGMPSVRRRRTLAEHSSLPLSSTHKSASTLNSVDLAERDQDTPETLWCVQASTMRFSI